MDCKVSVILYSSQTDTVVDIINREKELFVKLKFIKEKYGDVSNIFLNAYEWYVNSASKIVPKPDAAETAIWAFMDLINIEKHEGSKILKLEVPVEEAVFFDMHDWTKILKMTYIGTAEEESDFKARLKEHGVKFESDVATTSFYPIFKRELYESWNNLFKYNDRVKAGDYGIIDNIQAGLWTIKEQWILEVY